MKKEAINIPVCGNEKVPVAEHPFFHRIDIQTRMTDFDMLGHLNNSSYLQYADLAKIDYLKIVTGTKKVDFSALTVVIVNINASFFSPAYFNEPLSVLTACVKISRHSFVLEQRVVNPETGDVKCILTVVMAGFDPRTATGIELLPECIDNLRPYEEF